MTAPHLDARDVAVRSIQVMANGTLAEFEAFVHPEAINRESADEPPATRGTGPAAFYATALWLRSAYADLNWEIHSAIAEGDLVAVHATMSGRQVGPFVTYDAEGLPRQAFPATGKSFAVTQSHWFRIADGKVMEHWANRDDLGNATQLGWVPPTLGYIVRMQRATRRARRAAARG